MSALLKWNDEDPPDRFEQNRNEVVFTRWQHNRNPFIDHPEWVDDIFG
jgi:endonuclease I